MQKSDKTLAFPISDPGPGNYKAEVVLNDPEKQDEIPTVNYALVACSGCC